MAGTVNVTTSLAEFAELLRTGSDRDRCRDVLVLLWRWQRDPDLDEESQVGARRLVQRYGKEF